MTFVVQKSVVSRGDPLLGVTQHRTQITYIVFSASCDVVKDPVHYIRLILIKDQSEVVAK
jgi:hypothetical protein